VIVDVEMDDYPTSYQNSMPQEDPSLEVGGGITEIPLYTYEPSRPAELNGTTTGPHRASSSSPLVHHQADGQTHHMHQPEIVPVSWRDNRVHNAIKHAKKTWNKPLMRSSKYGSMDLRTIPEDEEHIEESPMLAPSYEKTTLKSKLGCPLCLIS